MTDAAMDAAIARARRRVWRRRRDASGGDIYGQKKPGAVALQERVGKMAGPGGRLPAQASGRATEKALPWPGVLSISSRPRWRATICLTMASPSPVPPSARERLSSTR